MARGDFGFNGQISAPGYGRRRIRVVKLGFGIGIIASADGEARTRRAFYSITTTGSSFTLGVAFVSYEEREAFNVWIRGFMEDVASGTARSGFMTVQCPARRFYRTGVPEGDLVYGKGVTDVGYVLSMPFVGATDPVDLTGKWMKGVSFFRPPKNDAVSRYFYPAGRQLSGAESLDGTIFDPTKTSGGVYVPAEEEDPVDQYGDKELPDPGGVF